MRIMSVKRFFVAILFSVCACHRTSAVSNVEPAAAHLVGCYAWKFEPTAGFSFPDSMRLVTTPVQSSNSSSHGYEGQIPRNRKQHFPGHVLWNVSNDSLSISYENFMYTATARVSADSLVGNGQVSSDVRLPGREPSWRVRGRRVRC